MGRWFASKFIFCVSPFKHPLGFNWGKRKPPVGLLGHMNELTCIQQSKHHTPTAEGLHCTPTDQRLVSCLPCPATTSHIHNACADDQHALHTLRAFTAPSNHRASPHHTHSQQSKSFTHPLNDQSTSYPRASHTPTHTSPTTEHFTRTPPQRVSLPQPRCFLHTPKSKMLSSYTQQPALSIQTPPQKKTPSTSSCLPQQQVLEHQDVQLRLSFQINEQRKIGGGRGRMAGESNYTRIFSLLIRDSFSSLLWLQLNLFLMRCGLSRSGR